MLAVYAEYASLETTLPDTAQIISIEHSNRFRLLADVPPIESRIDLLELQGTDLVVSDLKSSRSRWNDAKVLESISQLVLYATGLVPLMKSLGEVSGCLKIRSAILKAACIFVTHGDV